MLATREQLAVGARELEGGERFYLDTEFESSRHGKRLSLIQISRGDEVFIVDALALPSLEELGPVLFRAGAEWILHAGLQDVELLLAAFNRAEPPSLFDTQVVWSLLGPEAGVSLAFLQFKVLGVRSSKGYQADDWLRRPLPAAQIEYAARDITYLPLLEKSLRERARSLGRDHLIHEVCRDQLLPKAAPPLALTFESFRNAWQLDGAGQNALRALIGWYNALPAEASPLQSRTLLSIASRQPHNVKDLSRIKGVSAGLCRTHGALLVSLLEQSRATAGAGAEIEPNDYGSFADYVREARLMLIRAELCAELSVAPDLALPMATVRRMLQRAKSEGTLAAARSELSGWRAELLEPGFTRHVKRFES